MPIGLLLDGLVALLLVLTVAYCHQLNRRLGALRSGQDGLKDLIRGLNDATERAQAGIAQLKMAGDAAGKDLKEAVSRARELSDELSLMIEAGNNIADRLENCSQVRRRDSSEEASSGLEGGEPAERGHSVKETLDNLEGDLLRALREAR